MNKDIRIETSWRDHPKRKKLQRRLGDTGLRAWIDLLLVVAQNKPDGILTNWDNEDLVLAADWPGDPEEFVSALIDVRLLDKLDSGVLSIHEWAQHNPFAAHAEDRSQKAQKAARSRWNQWEKTEKGGNTKDMQPVESAQNNNTKTCSEHNQAMLNDATSINEQYPLPSPSPSPSPSPNKKKEKKDHSQFSFEEWQNHIKNSFDLLLSDRIWLDTMIERYPKTDIPATIEEARDYWIGREGYDKKKGSKNCNWKTTLQNAFKTNWLKVPKDTHQAISKQTLNPDGLYQEYLVARRAAAKDFKSSLDIDDLRTKFRDDWLKKDPGYTKDYPDWEKRMEPHFQHKLAGYIEDNFNFPSFKSWKK